VDAVMPLMKGMPKIDPENYVREKDRKPAEDNGEFHASDEDVPFMMFLAPLAGLLLTGLGLIA
jgi:hypothetical protein